VIFVISSFGDIINQSQLIYTLPPPRLEIALPRMGLDCLYRSKSHQEVAKYRAE
jgi:hypothetical protein